MNSNPLLVENENKRLELPLPMLGYKNDDISKTTKYTLNTVKTYRKNLYSKLEIHETRELFLRARKVVRG